MVHIKGSKIYSCRHVKNKLVLAELESQDFKTVYVVKTNNCCVSSSTILIYNYILVIV